MKTTTAPHVENIPALYGISEAKIAEEKARCADLKSDTPKGYEEVKHALARVRSSRTAIEARRKELKADSLEYGRRIDAAAKHFTALVLEIEEPLLAEKEKIDGPRRLAKAAAERLEAERLEAERAAQAAEVAAEAQRLAAEREAFEAEKRALERAEFERKAKIAAEEEAKARVEAERVAAEEAAVAEAERKAALEKRRQAFLPDREKLTTWMLELLAVPVPTLASDEAQNFAGRVTLELDAWRARVSGELAE
jgi:hypothetical protein